MSHERGVLGLAAIRRNRGITLQQIAQTTKIGVRWLEAIERGEFQKLPGGIYRTSYIRQYARAIDYDEDAIIAFSTNRSNEAIPARELAKPNLRGGSGMVGNFRRTSIVP
jgi:cytoskeletal protein RodZ